MRTGRPNVLMIVTDQEQPWALLPKTLRLLGRERIARQATHFTQFHISGSICSPCRSVLYTGQHWQATGIFDNIQRKEVRPFPKTMPTLGTMFKALGYRTAYRGKWHVSFLDDSSADSLRASMRPFGFDSYSSLPEANGVQDGYYRDPVVAKETFAFLSECAAERQPWLLAVNFINPHDIMFYRAWEGQIQSLSYSRIRPAPEDSIYGAEWKEDLPPNFGPDSLAGKPAAIARNREVYNMMLGEIPDDRRDLWSSYRQYYFNCLRDVDRHISAVLDALEASGEADNTIIVFTADHGEMAGAHGLRDKGSACYRELANVPFLVSHPDFREERETAALMSQVDVAPTLLSLAGMPLPEQRERFPDIAGIDMSPVMAAGGDPRRERGVLLNVGNTIFLDPSVQRRQMRGELPADSFSSADMSNRGMARGLFDGRYKFVRWFAPNDHHLPPDFETLAARNDLELYDMQADPFEINNLAAQPNNVRDLLTKLNVKCNSLIADEIGADDGRHMAI